MGRNGGFGESGSIGDGIQRGGRFTLDDSGFGFAIPVSYSGHVRHSGLQLLVRITVSNNCARGSRDDEFFLKLLVLETEFDMIFISPNEFLRKF